MTVHKSKGLGFPLVYVAHLGESLSKKGRSGDLSYNRELGYGLRYLNEMARTQRGTLMQSAVKLKEAAADRAERARVLYVAMTRAMNRMVLVGTAGEKDLNAADLRTQADSGIPADITQVRSAPAMLNWITQSVSAADAIEQWDAEPQSFPGWAVCQDSAPVFRYVFHMDPLNEELTKQLQADAAAGETDAERLLRIR